MVKYKKSLSIFLASLVFLSIFTYLLSEKVKEYPLKHDLIESLSSQFPGADIQIDSVRISFGSAIKAYGDGLSIKLKKNNKLLLKAPGFKIRVPIWALLFKTGKVSFYLKNPEIYFEKVKDTFNWSESIVRPKIEKKLEKAPNPTAKDLSNKSSENKAKFNFTYDLKIFNMDVFYNLEGLSSGSVLLGKFILKNFSLNNSFAFELLYNYKSENLRVEGVPKTSYDALIIGDMNLGKLIKNEVSRASTVVKLSNINLPNTYKEISSVVGNFNFNIKSVDEFEVKVRSTLNTQSSFDADVKVAKDYFAVSNIAADLNFKDIYETLTKITSVKVSDGSLKISGRIEKEKNKVEQDLSLDVGWPIDVTIYDSLVLSNKLKGKISNEKVELDLSSDFEGGVLNIAFKTELNLSDYPKNIKKIEEVKLDLLGSNFSFPADLVRRYFYESKEEESENKVKVVQVNPSKDGKVFKPVSKKKRQFPKFSGKLDFRDITANAKTFGLLSQYSLDDQKMVFDKGALTLENGRADFDSKIFFKDFEFNRVNTNLKVNSVDLAVLRPFLPNFFKKVEGAFSGKIVGNTRIVKNSVFYKYNVNLSARDGRINGLNLNKHANNLMRALPPVDFDENQKIDDYSDDFSKLNVNASLGHKKFQIKSFLLVGPGSKYEISGKGNLYPYKHTRPGQLIFNFKEGEGPVKNLLFEITGTDYLPIKFIFSGFKGEFDKNHSLKFVAKKAFKKDGKSKLDLIKKRLKKSKSKTIRKLVDKFLK